MHPAMMKEEGTGNLIFYWNVDSAVGLNSPNKFEDVMFVQWCFYKMTTWNHHSLPADFRSGLGKAGVNGSCTGRADDPLVVAIKAVQERFHLVVDGRVQPPSGDYYFYHGSPHRYFIFYLNAVLRALHPQQYPRIDLMPEFIWRVRDKAVAPFI
jgi:hypothetical protein